MQDLKQKLADQGLVGTLTIRETGQKIPLRFARGETKKLCKLELGPTSADVELRLVEIPGAKPDQVNLTLTLWSGGPAVIETSVNLEEHTAQVDASAKAEADAKIKAQADAEAAAQAPARADAETSAPIPVETPTSSSQSVAPSSLKPGGDRKGRL